MGQNHSHSIVYEDYNILNSLDIFMRKNVHTVIDTVRKSRF